MLIKKFLKISMIASACFMLAACATDEKRGTDHCPPVLFRGLARLAFIGV